MKSSISQIKKKTSADSLVNRLDQVKDRISGLQDKIEELEHSGKDKK
jgi:TolA-binding protein